MVFLIESVSDKTLQFRNPKSVHFTTNQKPREIVRKKHFWMLEYKNLPTKIH